MARELLKRANRELLRAIEAPPPDYSVENRIDWFAAELWRLADGEYDPDHGRLERIDHKLASLQEQKGDQTADYIARARSYITSYRETNQLSH